MVLKILHWVVSEKMGILNTTKVSNSLDPDQAQHFVGPDLDPNCLQRLAADDNGR